MRFELSLRTFSLSLATATFLFTGVAMAQQMEGGNQAAQEQSLNAGSQSWQLVGATARLDKSLDSQKVRPGFAIAAKLDHEVKTAEGVTLPGGSELMGTVVSAQASENGSPASVSILFNKAQMKNGREVPVKVTVVGAYPASEAMQSMYGDQTMGSAPRHVSSRQQIDQEPGVLHDIAMKSNVLSDNSAIFLKRNGNFTLHAGTYLQVGIAPQNGNTINSGM